MIETPFAPTILLLDDDPAVARSTSRLLTRAGFQVLVAHSPEEATSLARSHPGPIHLLLADVVLPQKSGPEAAKDIADIRPEIRALFVSGYLEEDLLDRGEAVFRGKFLSKPYEGPELVARVREIVADSQALS